MSLRTVTQLGGLFAVLGITACGGHIVIGEDPGLDGGSAGATTNGVGAGSGSGATGGAAGASGSATGTGGNPSGSGGAGSGTAGTGGDPGGSGGTGGGVLCGAVCGVRPGTAQIFASSTDAYEALRGVWRFCADATRVFSGAPADTIGIEFGAPAGSGGDLYYLVPGPSGLLQRGVGFEYQLRYDWSETRTDFGISLQLNIHPTPNSGFGPGFNYSPCPMQWQMTAMYKPDEKVVLVRP